MNTIYKCAAIALVTLISLASCGHAGAQSDKNKTQNRKGVIELNADTFNNLGDKPAIVDFTASWCGPCQRIAPILEEIAVMYEGKVAVYKVDVDKNRELAKKFNISSIPAILYIPLNSEPVMTVGARDKGTFVSEIDKILLNK